MELSKRERLEYAKAETEKALRRRTPKARFIRLAALVLLLAGSAAAIGYGVKATNTENEEMVSQVIQGGELAEGADIHFEHLRNPDVFAYWSEHILGNDINQLLSDGTFYVGGGKLICPTGESETMSVMGAAGQEGLISGVGSYLNLIDGTLWFRDDVDRNLYRYRMDGSMEQPQLLSEGNYGEVCVCRDRIFAVDHDQSDSLVTMDLTGEHKNVVIDRPVHSFMACGTQIMYLDTDQTLWLQDEETGQTQKIAKNIERFFFNGRVYAESQNKILSFTPSGSSTRLIYESSASDFRMVSLQNDRIYLQEEQELMYLTEEGPVPICSEETGIFTSAAEISENVLAVAVQSIGTGEAGEGIARLNIRIMDGPDRGEEDSGGKTESEN